VALLLLASLGGALFVSIDEAQIVLDIWIVKALLEFHLGELYLTQHVFVEMAISGDRSLRQAAFGLRSFRLWVYGAIVCRSDFLGEVLGAESTFLLDC